MSLGPGPLHSMAYASAPPAMGRKPGMINLDKITHQSQSSMVPINHIAFLSIAKMIQAGCVHFLREWIRVDQQHQHQKNSTSYPFSVMLFWLLAMGALVSLAIERPWSRKGRSLTSSMEQWNWSKIAVYGAALAGQMYLFLWGLWALPTFRVLMLTQYANIWMVAVLASLAGKRSSTSTKQYSFVVMGGILACFISDIYMRTPGTSLFTVISGYVALLLSTQLSIYQRGVSRRLSSELGGNKVLHAVALAVAAAIVSPVAMIQYTLTPSMAASLSSTASSVAPGWIGFLILSVGMFVVDFYVNQSISQRVSPMWHVLTGWPIVLGSSCFTGLLVSKALGANLMDVLLSVVILYGMHELLQADAVFADARLDPEEGLQRHQHLPSYDRQSRNGATAQAYSTGSGSGLGDIAMYIRAILADQDSKQIFYFLLLNLSFMFVQMLYGVWTNSLGLISDSIHMFFDCLALGVGLFASVMSKWDANRSFSYGYNRVETLSGFSNGIFLCLISIFIVIEAVERLIHPPDMNTHRLLLVSFLGFVVNMIGIFAFNHGHGHGHGHSHGHGHDHHGHHHHHHGHDHGHGHNANMQGVFLHIMADTLGSVGVIISTLLIDWFGWTGFDPIASIFIAVLIFLSVIPLIKDSAAILMLHVPEGQLGSIEHALEELQHVPGVASYKAARFWPNSPESLIGSIHIVVAAEEDATASVNLDQIRQAVEQALLGSISGLSEVTVQVEQGSSGLPTEDQQQQLLHGQGHAHEHGHSHGYLQQPSLQPSLQHQHYHEDHSQHAHHNHTHIHNHSQPHHDFAHHQIKSL